MILFAMTRGKVNSCKPRASGDDPAIDAYRRMILE